MDNSITNIKKIHPLWMIYEFGKSLRAFIFFLLFLSLLFRFSFNSIISTHGLIIITAFVIYQISSIFLEWKNFEYSINSEDFFIKRGKLSLLKRYFPLENIQGLNQSTPFFHRMFGLTVLLIDCGSSDKDSSIKLEMISSKEAGYIKKVLSESGNVNITDLDELGEAINERPNEVVNNKHYELTWSELLISSLTSLRLAFFLTVLYSIYSQVSQFFSLDKYISYIFTIFQSSFPLLILGIILLIALAMGYGVLKAYIQYGGFTVSSDKYRVFIEKGKINKSSFSIPINRIQAISINSGFIHRALKIVKVKIISSSDTENEEAKSSNVLFPFIPKSTANRLIPKVIPTFYIEGDMKSIPKRSIFVKLFRTSYIWILIPLTFYYLLPGLWYFATVILIFTLLSQILGGLFSSYSLNGSFIKLKKGAISSRTFITKRNKIERLIVTETLLQKKMGLSSIKVVSRARPSEITTMHDLPKTVAYRYYLWYADGLESSETNIS